MQIVDPTSIPTSFELPEDFTFPFKPDGNGGVLQFFWRRFNWELLIGRRDSVGYYVTNWTPRDSERGPLPHKLDKVHRVVWRVYNGPIPAGLEIDHVDGDKGNNHISNLRLVTHAENIRLARERLGNWSPSKLTPEQREWIIGLPSKSDWSGLALQLKVHKVTLLSIRCKAKKALLA